MVECINSIIETILAYISKAKDMIRHDQIGELLQQRQDKDIRKLNEVTLIL